MSFDGKINFSSQGQTGVVRSIAIDLVDKDGRRSSYTQMIIVHLSHHEDNEEEEEEDSEKEEISKVDQAILDDSVTAVNTDKSSQIDPASSPLDSVSTEDLLFKYRPLTDKLSTGLSQFELQVQK